MVEDHEEDIEEWYNGDQKQNIIDYLCRDKVLKANELGEYCIIAYSSDPNLLLQVKRGEIRMNQLDAVSFQVWRIIINVQVPQY